MISYIFSITAIFLIWIIILKSTVKNINKQSPVKNINGQSQVKNINETSSVENINETPSLKNSNETSSVKNINEDINKPPTISSPVPVLAGVLEDGETINGIKKEILDTTMEYLRLQIARMYHSMKKQLTENHNQNCLQIHSLMDTLVESRFRQFEMKDNDSLITRTLSPPDNNRR